jgi:ATP-dependent RNA helicase RhlE
VINFDVPSTPEQYTHRIGRTGRAQLEGTACTFVTVQDHEWLRATERMIGERIRRDKIAGFEADGVDMPAVNSGGARFGEALPRPRRSTQQRNRRYAR